MTATFIPESALHTESQPSRHRRPVAYRLTQRDLALAAFIDRVGYATSEQVRRRFGLSDHMCWRRLRALRESGRVRSSRPLAGPSILYPAGAPAPNVRYLDHALTATSVALQLEAQGVEVVTERMMRQDEYTEGQRSHWSIPVSQQALFGEKVTHRPDLAIKASGGLVAIEVELTRKSKRRMARIMGAWARQGRYCEVRYLCRSAVLRDLVAAEAMQHGADLVVRASLLADWLSTQPHDFATAETPDSRSLPEG